MTFPTVLITPAPTVTVGAKGAASTLAGAVTIALPDARLGLLGTPAGGDPTYWSPLVIYYNGTGQTVSANVWGVSFTHTGQAFEIRVRGNAGKYRVVADGRYATDLGQAIPWDGGLYLVKVDFGSVATRNIVIQLTFDTYFGGVNIAGTDTLVAYAGAIGPRVCFIGDSFLTGTGADSQLTSLHSRAAMRLGWFNVAASAQGGTGYAVPTAGQAYRYIDRVAKDIEAFPPDIVILTGGVNDSTGGYTASLRAAAAALIARLALTVPRIILMTPFQATDTPAWGIAGARVALLAAAASGGVEVVDVCNPARLWITGSGYVGATNGSGNSDMYTYADGTHPSQAGHDYLGTMLAFAIRPPSTGLDY